MQIVRMKLTNRNGYAFVELKSLLYIFGRILLYRILIQEIKKTFQKKAFASDNRKEFVVALMEVFVKDI